MMDMRKTCNHPYLIEYPLSEDGNFYRADEDMVDICGKLKVLDQMLSELAKRGHKTLIFSQMTRMLDILGDYLNYRYKTTFTNRTRAILGVFLEITRWLYHYFSFTGRKSFPA